MFDLRLRLNEALKELEGLSPKEAIFLQKKLSSNVRLEKFDVSSVRVVAGADVSYLKEYRLALAAVVITELPNFKVLAKSFFVDEIKFPYVPGLLAFRELPALLNCFHNLTHSFDAVLVDGHGIAHPRRFGLASHLGIILNKPTVGVAKKLLHGEKVMPGKKKGDMKYIYDENNKPVCVVLRTRENVKPIYISPGNRVDVDSSLEFIKRTTGKYRIPEPLRLAHQLTQKLKRSLLLTWWRRNIVTT